MSDKCQIHDCDWHEGRASDVPGRYCSWDGSLDPDQFMAYCESGQALLTPTDKNYKVYIDVEIEEGKDELRPMILGSGELPASYPNAVRPTRKQRKLMRENGHPFSASQKDCWVVFGAIGTKRHGKFYFEHLSEDQKKRFIELLNEQKLCLDYPGHFYRLPFFCTRGTE